MTLPPPEATASLAQWLDYIEHQHPSTIALGLDRVRTVADRLLLGRIARHVVTVAGTNGKGSTVVFAEAMALAAGWSVVAYTSPHLMTYNERVRIDGQSADDATLIAAFQAVEHARTDGPAVALTYFEFGTLAALWIAAQRQPDLAILEVGLGGRLDATNLVDADVAVITTVDLDHQAYLGEDREAIGLEKAAIARAWRPLVLGDDDPPASVLRHAYAMGASAIRAGCDFLFEAGPAGQWTWREVGATLTLPCPQLAAPVQLRNAAVAIAALRALDRPLPDEAIATGVAGARLAGRVQVVVRDGVDVVLDVAHNPQAARAVAAWLRERPPAGRTLAVLGMLDDKDVAGVHGAFDGLVDAWHVASLADVPRGLDASSLVACLAPAAAPGVACHADVATALAVACTQAGAGGRVLVLGSFHTVARALQALDLA